MMGAYALVSSLQARALVSRHRLLASTSAKYLAGEACPG